MTFVKPTAQFISDLAALAGNAHIAHLNADTWDEHKVLDDLYKQLPEHTDAIAESFLGIHTDVALPEPQIKFTEDMHSVLGIMVTRGAKLIKEMSANPVAVATYQNAMIDCVQFFAGIKYLLDLTYGDK